MTQHQEPVDTAAEAASPSKPGWTFLTNHAHVLLSIARQPEARVRDVAHHVGVTERRVQGIIADLEKTGYVTRVHRGRRNYYQIHSDRPLRHPADQHHQVSALLRLMLGEQEYDAES